MIRRTRAAALVSVAVVYVRLVRQCTVTPAAGVPRGLPRRESRRRGTQSGVEPGIVGLRLAAAREARRLHGQGRCRRAGRRHVHAAGAARQGRVREDLRRQEPGDRRADGAGHHLPPLLHDQADHRRRHDDPVRGRQVAARRSGHQVRARVQGAQGDERADADGRRSWRTCSGRRPCAR